MKRKRWIGREEIALVLALTACVAFLPFMFLCGQCRLGRAFCRWLDWMYSGENVDRSIL